MLPWNNLPLQALLQLPETLEFPGCAVGTLDPRTNQEELSVKKTREGMGMGCLQIYGPSLWKSSGKEG